jgi:hypothetical protein
MEHESGLNELGQHGYVSSSLKLTEDKFYFKESSGVVEEWKEQEVY